MENIDLSQVDWSRAQFALTAMYHWLFVPLTLGLTWIIAIMETIYVRTGKEEWKRITQFWMKLFGINFAIGVATGIILEFEFGNNWSNYSWFVGDIFGAPLAIEGIMAFFLETTFVAVMFFGWNKVSKKFHLSASWLVAIGSNLSALWILAANAWMQYPTGMHFNIDTARSEMINFWQVLFSPIAITKFVHTVTSAYVAASLFVIAVSSWYLLKKREIHLALKSIKTAAVFGLLASLLLAFSGDESGFQVAQKQPAKFAAMEAIYKGECPTGMKLFGVLDPSKKIGVDDNAFYFTIEIPKLLSILGYRNAGAFVPGANDLIYGNKEHNIISASEKIDKGKLAIASLYDYKLAKKLNDTLRKNYALKSFEENYKFMGYGYLKDPKSIIPNIPLTYYSFRIMVGLGVFFILLFIVILFLLNRKKLESFKLIQRVSIIAFPLGFIAMQTGWILAEVGRQPWAIQDLLPTIMATSNIDTSSVRLTFGLFLLLFTSLLIAEIKIMTTQIKLGPKGGNNV